MTTTNRDLQEMLRRVCDYYDPDGSESRMYDHPTGSPVGAARRMLEIAKQPDTDLGPIKIHDSAEGGWCLRDELGRVIATIPKPSDHDVRLGSPQRADQARSNVYLLASAWALRATLAGVEGMIRVELQRGNPSTAWNKALKLITDVLQQSRGQ